MRIVLLLLGACFSTAAAAARPATGSMVSNPGSNGALRGGGLTKVWSHQPWRGGGHEPRRGRWRRHQGGEAPAIVYPYAAGGLGWPVEAADPHGNGFFAGGGGEVRMEGGRPHYDYDRSYPYEWAPSGGAARSRSAEPARNSQAYCTMENGVRVCRGGW
ncbi:MAG: hypothetical protein QOJ91_244 [Sphingomonadales bacterium]|jgi:hypothetical protein|nr:hypothetical protein [Sphingomonadales bacterium]